MPGKKQKCAKPSENRFSNTIVLFEPDIPSLNYIKYVLCIIAYFIIRRTYERAGNEETVI